MILQTHLNTQNLKLFQTRRHFCGIRLKHIFRVRTLCFIEKVTRLHRLLIHWRLLEIRRTFVVRPRRNSPGD